MATNGEQTEYLDANDRARLRVGFKSCVQCGYFSRPVHRTTYDGSKPTHTIEDRHGEIGFSPRQDFADQLPRDIQVLDAHCFRGIWHNDNESDMAVMTRNPIKPRFCWRFYPYSEGEPSEHRISHRNRTNRRWLVAGGLIGPYVATGVGFLASELSRNGSAESTLLIGLMTGFVLLSVVALVVNLTLNREG